MGASGCEGEGEELGLGVDVVAGVGVGVGVDELDSAANIASLLEKVLSENWPLWQ